MDERPKFKVQEDITLDKFEGKPSPGNLVERVHLRDGKIWKTEFFVKGILTATELTGGDSNSTN